MSRVKRSAKVAAILIPLTTGFEGIRQVAYRDPVGIPTICMGETKGVRMGMRKSLAECKGMMVDRLDEFGAAIDRCVKVPTTDERYAALVDFAYNVGEGGACKSSAVRLINAGRTRQGCQALMLWNKAKGIPLPGLTRRRGEERDLCLKGI